MSVSRLPTTSAGSGALSPAPAVYRIWEKVLKVPVAWLTSRRSCGGTLAVGSTLPEARAPLTPETVGPSGCPPAPGPAPSATTSKAVWPPLASCLTSEFIQVLASRPTLLSVASGPSTVEGVLAFSCATANPPAAWLCAASSLASRSPLLTCAITTKPSERTTASDISRVAATTRSWMLRRHSRTAGSSGRRTRRTNNRSTGPPGAPSAI